jgi:uncharacterized Ntn-hydrolase superfamily protein
MLGVAVTTSSICVSSRCPWARAGVGAVATQNISDPSLGPKILDLLAAGRGARQALAEIVDQQANIAYRQLTVIDANGAVAHHSGSHTLGTHAVAQGENCVSAGNLLANDSIPKAMVDTFMQHTKFHLAERLLRALEAGLRAGGELGPIRSAGLLVVHKYNWPLVDLRIDWSDESPLAALRALWEVYQPQMEDYVTRALNPQTAPSFGVAGDP